MVFPDYVKRRILYSHSQGHNAPTIAKLLAAEDIRASRRGVYAFLVQVERYGNTKRHPGNGQSSKITGKVKGIVEAKFKQMTKGQSGSFEGPW